MSKNANMASDFLDKLLASGNKASSVYEGLGNIGFDSAKRVVDNQLQFGNGVIDLGLGQFSDAAGKDSADDVLHRQKTVGEAFYSKAESYFQNLREITRETQHAYTELVKNTAAEAGQAFSSKAA